MSGGDNRSLAVYEFQEVQPLTVRNRFCFGEVSAIIRRPSGYGDSHVCGGLGSSNRLNSMDHVVAPTGKFTLELLDQGQRAVVAGALEGPTAKNRNNPTHSRHGDKNSEREDQQEFAAETHGFSVPSQTSPRSQAPVRFSPQFFTAGLSP